MSSYPGVTLQINLCAGDLNYADLTVPALIATHRGAVTEVLIVADACRPQSTPCLHAPSQFPPAAFSERVARLRRLCQTWLENQVVDRVEWVESQPNRNAVLNARYSGRATPWTHDHLGHAFTAYFAAWEWPRTRYVLHLDADVILHQAPGFSWIHAGMAALQSAPQIIAVSPRIAPPASDPENGMVDLRQHGNGWQPSWRLDRRSEGWHSDWFSTRCHLIDRERLAALLPLTPARGAGRDARAERVNRLLFPLYEHRPWYSSENKRGLAWLMDRLARRIAQRLIPPFPLPPEVMLHERARAARQACLYLADPRAWYIHPDTKPPALIRLLPEILRAVGSGIIPPGQHGFTGIRCTEWEPMLRAANL